jgi:Ca2+-binding EF-hand superfamily protein
MSGISGVGGFRPPPPGKPPSFEQVDSNSDGSLSLDEFKSGAPKNADSSKAEELFKSIDSDSDGSISNTESDAFKAEAKKAEQQLQSFLLGLQSNQASVSGTESEDDIFAQLDADSDGSITSDEFLEAISSEGTTSAGDEASSDLLGKLFDAIDSDSSGSLSEEETQAFQQAIERRGPPPPPPGASFSASQAYSSAFQLRGSSGDTGSSYSQAA